MSAFKIISLVCGCILIGSCCGSRLPPFLTPCSRSLPIDQLTSCVTEQGRKVQAKFAKGLPELNLEPLDPLTLSDIQANAGTFVIRSSNVVVKGLKKVEIREINWDLQKNTGYTKLYGNFTFLCDYETNGRVLLIPITGTGKLTVKMYDTEMLFRYKFRTVKGEDGFEYFQTYDSKPSERYGHVKINMSNILGGAIIGDTINQVLNENWREMMAEVGPPYTKAIGHKVHNIINKFYSQIPIDDMFSP